MITAEAITDSLPTAMYLQARRLHSLVTRPKYHRYLQSLTKADNSREYSFAPFTATRSIFVHIPKCAGISVNKALYGSLAGGHATFQDYLAIFDSTTLAKLFKFTIVRNPWDRVVSAYHFLQRGGFNEQDRNWFQRELSQYADFDEFVRRWLNHDNVWSWHHFKPQHHFMTERRSRVGLDFIGLFENLSADFSYIAKRVNPGATLPALNCGDHQGYESYYTDETRAIVAEVYAEDIKTLGYTFDNSSLQRQIEQRDRRLHSHQAAISTASPAPARLGRIRRARATASPAIPVPRSSSVLDLFSRAARETAR